MAKIGFLRRHGIVRNAIKEDVLYFGIPAILVFSAVLFLSAFDGWDGFIPTVRKLVEQPSSLHFLSAQTIIGLLLFVVGFTIMLFGQVTLFRNYSSSVVIRENHQLVTHGIYRITRNPMYLGLIMVITSFPLYATSLYGFLTSLVLIPLILFRIRLEERLLTEEFGEAYRMYKGATHKLIPFIY